MTTRRTTCSRSAGWIAAIVLSCACADDPDDAIDASMSQHTPTADSGAAGRDGSTPPFDAGSPDVGHAQSGTGGSSGRAGSGAGDASSGNDSGEPAADCSHAQAAAIAADLPETSSVTELIDALLDKLERAESVPYCSSH